MYADKPTLDPIRPPLRGTGVSVSAGRKSLPHKTRGKIVYMILRYSEQGLCVGGECSCFLIHVGGLRSPRVLTLRPAYAIAG